MHHYQCSAQFLVQQKLKLLAWLQQCFFFLLHRGLYHPQSDWHYNPFFVSVLSVCVSSIKKTFINTKPFVHQPIEEGFQNSWFDHQHLKLGKFLQISSSGRILLIVIVVMEHGHNIDWKWLAINKQCAKTLLLCEPGQLLLLARVSTCFVKKSSNQRKSCLDQDSPLTWCTWGDLNALSIVQSYSFKKVLFAKRPIQMRILSWFSY